MTAPAGGVTFNGGGNSRVFQTARGVAASIPEMTITEGRMHDGLPWQPAHTRTTGSKRAKASEVQYADRHSNMLTPVAFITSSAARCPRYVKEKRYANIMCITVLRRRFRRVRRAGDLGR